MSSLLLLRPPHIGRIPGSGYPELSLAANVRGGFYRENGVPFQIVYAWDPTHNKLPDGEHGPYELLPGNRFVSRGTDPPTDTWRTTYGYTVTATRLRLQFVSLLEPGLSAKQRLSDEKRPILMSSTLSKKLS